MFHTAARKVIDSLLSLATSLFFSVLLLTAAHGWTAFAGHGPVWHLGMGHRSLCRCIVCPVPWARVSPLVYSILCVACIMGSQHEDSSFSELTVFMDLTVHRVS